MDRSSAWRRMGLIPAHAGKTPGDNTRQTAPTAHPRSRGENPDSCKPGVSVPGSSPLTRGKPCTWRVLPVRRRLIPAHAGKTRALNSRGRRGAAHPRSRGENPLPSLVGGLLVGSSPLTRGKPISNNSRFFITGLIPAHAGKTYPVMPIAQSRPAHPRSRGENRSLLALLMRPSGSSPLTRGKPRPPRALAHARGLIPAHAGKTS